MRMIDPGATGFMLYPILQYAIARQYASIPDYLFVAKPNFPGRDQRTGFYKL